jgi:uncharacterized membrane protein
MSRRFCSITAHFMRSAVSSVALEAILLTSCVLIRQNISDLAFERRNHLDLQINLLAERESTLSLDILRRLAAHLNVQLTRMSNAKSSPKRRRWTRLRKIFARVKKGRRRRSSVKLAQSNTRPCSAGP